MFRNVTLWIFLDSCTWTTGYRLYEIFIYVYILIILYSLWLDHQLKIVKPPLIGNILYTTTVCNFISLPTSVSIVDTRTYFYSLLLFEKLLILYVSVTQGVYRYIISYYVLCSISSLAINVLLTLFNF